VSIGFLLLVGVQLPLILWILPEDQISTRLLNWSPWLSQHYQSTRLLFWPPLVCGLVFSVYCLRLIQVRLARPIVQVARQLHDLSQHAYEQELQITGSAEIMRLARACEDLRQHLRTEEAKNLKLAFEDSMTGLNNRTYFVRQLDDTLNRELSGVIVVVWSIDRFKSLNNILGFAAGDFLLKALGLRFRQQLGDCLLLARLANNTFAAAFHARDDLSLEDCATRILATLDEPVRVYGQPIELSASCGIACSPKDGHAASELVRRAEIAQSIATQSRMNWISFQNHFEVQSTARLNMLSELRAALRSRGQLQLFLQPKLDMCSGRIKEAEALVRWQHPQRGWVYPNEFIPFAEQTGRIQDITRWAIAEALDLLQSMPEHPDLRISVNVSALDLIEQRFADQVGDLLRAADILPSRLCLEITESHAMEDPNRVLQTLRQLCDHGIRLAIDDFGSGYSSLAYMKRFPVHELKIDRALVAGVKPSSDSETILRCTIELGHHMGLEVTAEGVETLEEFAVLRSLQVDSMQGYLIGKAMPVEQFRQFTQRFDPFKLLNPNTG
jgi:diguanylate cyclase (GGDEF)-like protein